MDILMSVAFAKIKPTDSCCLLWIDEAKDKDKTYMSVGVMEDYKLRDLRASNTVGPLSLFMV